MYSPLDQRIAVIVPTRDRRQMCLRALDSVLAQTRPPDELVVVDDGSTDGTADSIRARFGERVRVEVHAPLGVSAARNRGVEVTSCEWLAFLDSDDEWRPEKLKRQLAALAAAPEHLICHCDEIWIRNGNQVLQRQRHRKRGGFIFRDCLRRCVVSPSAVVLRRDLFERLGGFDESLPACEDYDLWLRICARHPVLFVDEPLVVKHGGHADQLSRTVPALDRFRIRALEKVISWPELSPDDRTAAWRELARRVEIYAGGCDRRGRLAEAARTRARFARLAGSGHARPPTGCRTSSPPALSKLPGDAPR